MERHSHSDIAAFPELFDGLEQFIEEQAAGFKRTSAILAAIAVTGSGLLMFAFSMAA